MIKTTTYFYGAIMNILLISPKYANSRFSLEDLIKFLGIIEGFLPPILLKISSLLPRVWNKKMIDMNGSELKDEYIVWADFVLISGELTQARSAKKIIERCKKLNTKVVASGPLLTSNDEYYKHVDHLVFDEAEIIHPQFFKRLE
jgi:hypothetical protein